jgi:ribonuclease P protein component
VISRRHRFHGSNSVQTVYRRGQSYRGPSLSVKICFRDETKPFRVAVVVSRKVSKSAVIRNRIRRRIYEAVRTDKLNLKNGTDLVLTVFGEQFASMDAASVTDIIHNLLKQIV